MPCKLVVGLSQRQGFSDGTEVGATCQLKVELPVEMLQGAGTPLQRRAEMLFDACREVVGAELARRVRSSPGACDARSLPARRKASPQRRAARPRA